MVIRNCTDGAATHQVGSRIFTRISLPVAAVGILLLASGIYGAWSVYGLQKRSSDMLSENVASIRAAEELETVIREFEYRLKRFLSTDDVRHLERISERISEAQRWLAETEALATTPREQQLAERISRGFERFLADHQRVTAEPPGEFRTQLARSMGNEVIPNKILHYSTRYIELNGSQLAESSERNQASARQLVFGLLMLGSCGGIAGLLAGYAIAHRVRHTIVQLSLPIRDAAGKLNEVVGPVSLSAEPEIEDLQAILQTVSGHVSTVVERLQDREREMLRAEQLAAVGQLAAGLAHELRNPLTSTKTVLQLAEVPEDLSPRDLQVLKQEMGRLEQSVQTFLDFARPPQPEKRGMELGELLDQTVDLVSRRAQQQNIDLQYRRPPQPVLLVADATLLRQVVLNLLLNAFDAVPRDGTVRMETGTETVQVEGNGAPDAPRGEREWVILRVSDDGPGLPGSLGERIFEPFISTKETGIGLGLSICRRIVEAHGGEIHAEDRAEGGTLFTVRLPREESSHARPSSSRLEICC